MPRSILVGLDGSSDAEAAVDLGIRWARHFDALLVGLGVIDRPTICKPEPVPIGGTSFKESRDESLLADARHRVEQFLESFALRCSDAGVACKLLEDVGLPAERILLEAQRYDLILLGQRTHFHFETQPDRDETLHDVVRLSARPVVVVPERRASGTATVVAYDGSLQSARAIQAFQAVGLDGSHDVHVVCVDADFTQAAQHAERAVEFLRFHEIAAHAQPVATSAPAGEALLTKVRELKAGLMVMGAFGRSALKEFIFGSVTQTVLRDSSVPVFLYH